MFNFVLDSTYFFDKLFIPFFIIIEKYWRKVHLKYFSLYDVGMTSKTGNTIIAHTNRVAHSHAIQFYSAI